MGKNKKKKSKQIVWYELGTDVETPATRKLKVSANEGILSVAYAEKRSDVTEHQKQIDKGISWLVGTLEEYKIPMFSSCQGGEGHAFEMPTIRLYQFKEDGYKTIKTLQHILEYEGYRDYNIKQIYDFFGDGSKEYTVVYEIEFNKCSLAADGSQSILPKNMDIYNEDVLAPTCTKCNSEMQIVRPGKYQCHKCERGKA